MNLGRTQSAIMGHAYRNAGDWFTITSCEPDTIRAADRLVSRGLLEHGATLEGEKRPRQYRAPVIRAVLRRIHREYQSDPFGVDIHTIAPGWREALKRAGAPIT